VFKVTEQITKYTKKVFGENEKICPKNEGMKLCPLGVTALTTSAMAVQNSSENPDDVQL